MSKTLEEVMAGHSDEALLDVLAAGEGQYTEAALVVAQAEVEKRKLSSERVESVLRVRRSIHQRRQQFAEEPLEKGAFYLALFLPMIARMVYLREFARRGYDRKIRELTNAAYLGVLIKIGIVVLLVLLFKLL